MGWREGKSKEALFWRFLFGIFSPVYRRKYPISSGPLFIQYIQEFSIEQGVGGSQPGVDFGFVWILFGNGGWGGAGLEGWEMRKNRGFWEEMEGGCSGIVDVTGFF
ncbi:MAG: hypothetical protein LUQ04_01425 [Methanoregula sp.]|nr:hypothetical protein [Methanoregula sp.]